MWQEILVLTLFIGALAYLAKAVYQQFQAKSSCAAGCGKCSAVDFKKIEADLKSKGI
jgi:hypothetical protein